MNLDIVFSQLKRHKLRTALTIIGVAIGIMLITSMASFSEGLRVSIGNELSLISGLVTVAQKDISFTNIQASELDEELVKEFEGMSDVEKTAAIVFTRAGGFSIMGFNIKGFEDMFPEMTMGLKSGRYFEEGTNEVTLGSIFAENGDYTIGDVIKIHSKDYIVTGVWKEIGNPEDDNSISTSLETAQEISGKPSKVTLIMLKPNSVNDADKIAEEINNDYDDVIAFTQKDAQKESEKFVAQINVMTYAIGGIASIISAIVIMNVMFMSVRERRREIGTLKAIGATDMQILSQILLESVSMALIGGMIGLALSFGVVAVLNSVLGTKIALITARLALTSILFSVLLGIFGGVLPARMAYKLEPVVALRYE